MARVHAPGPRAAHARPDVAANPPPRTTSITTTELAVIPACDALGLKLECDALGGLCLHGLQELGSCRIGAVALEQLHAKVGDELEVAMDDSVGLDHHPAQLLVLLAVFNLQGGPVVALEVADLLGLGVRPGPDVIAADHVPERHQMRPSSRTVCRADHNSLLGEELGQLLFGQLDLVAPAHAEIAPAPSSSASAAVLTAARASSGSSTVASPASLSTSRTSQSTPAKLSSDRKSTRLNSSHANISYAVFC